MLTVTTHMQVASYKRTSPCNAECTRFRLSILSTTLVVVPWANRPGALIASSTNFFKMATQIASENGHLKPLISTEMLQVVDYEEQFNKKLHDFLIEQHIAKLGFDYHVAAIMGAQSSGKSTLLNLLFGTKFRTMDEATGRYQVTQGVWLGRDADAGIIVMDLEGTDSRERGEDAATYERKSSLLALALAEVLIVNIWANDVGRYNAANMSLLKTVLELDLQLFFGGAAATPAESVSSERLNVGGKPRMHKTRLLFVLRDHASSPFETLCDTLRTDVDKIWNTISKPEAAMGTSITNYFDLDFFSFPHKVYEADMFYAKGKELRRRFHENEVFLEEYSRGVAADGFAAYAESVWETIRANRELDIPSQKEMLAHVRCEQIAREAISKVDAVLAPLQVKLLPVGGSPSELEAALFPKLLNACNDALETYESQAFRYSTAVAEMKGADLKSKIGGDCKALFDAQLLLASDLALKDFRTTVSGSQHQPSSSRERSWEKWGTVSKSAMDSALSTFDIACSTSFLSGNTELLSGSHPLSFMRSSADGARRRVTSALGTELERATKDVMAAARNRCIKTFRDAFKPPLNIVLDNASDDVWDRTTEVSSVAWDATVNEAQNVYGENGLGFSEERLEEAIEDDIKPVCYENALTDIKDAIGTPSNFLLRMTKRFNDSFRFDERGVPRHFGPNEDLEALLVASREKAEELIELLCEMKLTGPLTNIRSSARSIDAETAQPVILPAHSRDDLREQLKRQAGAVFMEAKRAQEAAKITTKIPPWVFILIVILGWNELLAVLRNPLLFLLTVVVVPLLYVGYTLDAPTVLGPAVRATINPLLDQAKAMINDATTPQPATIGAGPSSAATGVTTPSESNTDVSMNNSLHKD